ncbi:glyoxalase [Marinobacter lipolyticus SM19]|uniref:Glyoxalase n=1 Tax=Marinobacter lipolyticus SM19 TaxID=1318628 RepID=R8AZM7_9GAMM|nr:VOC family protein [Marinobacter lipolyticus]EON91769.1 glyoxalase [Marinobacter lipolyticus SM19]
MALNKEPNQPTRPVGVHSLDHFALNVPCLETAHDFYTSFGLDVREESGVLVLRSHFDPHPWAYLHHGTRKSLRQICFGVYAKDLPIIEARVRAEGLSVDADPEGLQGFWFHDCDGTRVGVRVAPKVTPDEKASTSFEPVPVGNRGAPYRRHAPKVRPRRLSHILLFTRNLNRTLNFYSRILGLRLSDRAADIVAFMHAIHGADHHTVAFVQSEAPGFHHCSWDVASINEVGLGAMFMADKGWAEGWGLGRHVLGSNYFHYVRDPWGSYSEYSFDIDYVPAGVEWQSADHPPEDSLYLWGPEAPPEFTINFEAL